MPQPNYPLPLKREAYGQLYDALIPHRSLDDFGIDIWVADRPVRENLKRVKWEYGLPSDEIQALSALAFWDVVRDELPINFVLPKLGNFLCQN